VNEEEKIVRCARAAHNTMVTYCRMHGDHTIDEWDDAKEWQRQSTIAMVKSVLAGNYSPRGEHGRWLKEKADAGYVWGPVKNDDKKRGQLTNPNILDYGKLPLIQRMKDSLLIVVTVGMAAHYSLDTSKVNVPELELCALPA
jgi:hypothetical protein